LKISRKQLIRFRINIDKMVRVEPIRRKIPSRGSTPENAPRIRTGLEKKEQQSE
jgi:hypothetical protein